MKDMKRASAITVQAQELESFCRNVLIRVGLAEAHAQIIAESLVKANLHGVDTHGVVRLPIYVKRMEMGLISTNPTIELQKKAVATAVLDGGNAPGQVVAMRAMEEAIELAKRSGVGLVGAKNSNHFGAAAFFATRALEDDMIGIALTHAESDVIPYGGRRPCLGTNPLAVAVPAGDEPPVVLDMATSIVAMGNVIVAAKEGRPIPDSWAVDIRGDATTDPKKARAVRPLGGPKGYGLAIIIDILSGILTGSSFGLHINRMYDNFSEPQAIGHLLGAINISTYIPIKEFKGQMDQMIREIRSVPPANGFNRVLLPGEPELQEEKRRLREGIPLSEEIYKELEDLSREFGVELAR